MSAGGLPADLVGISDLKAGTWSTAGRRGCASLLNGSKCFPLSENSLVSGAVRSSFPCRLYLPPWGMLLCAVIQGWCWLHRLYLSSCPLHVRFIVFSKEQMRTEETKANGQIIHVKGFPGSQTDPGFLEQSTLLPSSRVSAYSFPFAWNPFPASFPRPGPIIIL